MEPRPCSVPSRCLPEGNRMHVVLLFVLPFGNAIATRMIICPTQSTIPSQLFLVTGS